MQRMNFPQLLETKYLEWQSQQGKRKTLDDFAEHIGVRRSVLSNWLTGRRNPGAESLRQLSSALGFEVYDVLGLPRPDEDLAYISQHWDQVSEEFRRKFREQVEQHWDEHVRSLPHDSLWYATLAKDGMKVTATTNAYNGRKDAIEEDTRLICARANVPYLSPHKLRHGHVVYALKLAHNMAELKAISQNVMHSSVTITDQVYGKLIADDVKNIIGKLGTGAVHDIEEKIAELIRLLNKNNSV